MINVNFSNNTTHAFNANDLKRVPYFRSLLNFETCKELKEISLNFEDVHFLPLFNNELHDVDVYDKNLVTSYLSIMDFLSWYDIEETLLTAVRNGITMKDHFRYIYNCKSSLSSDILKEYSSSILPLFHKLDRSQVVYLCKLFQHSSLGELVTAVHKWSKKHNDNTIWDDISIFSYAMEDNIMSELLRIPEVFQHKVVQNCLTKARFTINHDLADIVRVDLPSKKSVTDNENFSVHVQGTKVTIKSKDSISIIICGEGQTFEYLRGYSGLYLTIAEINY